MKATDLAGRLQFGGATERATAAGVTHSFRRDLVTTINWTESFSVIQRDSKHGSVKAAVS